MKKFTKTTLWTVAISFATLFFNLTLNAQNTFPSTGNVGIGVSSPADLLHVGGNLRVDNNLVFTGSGKFFHSGNADLKLNINGHLLFDMLYSKNVGIGINSPLSKFHVNGDIRSETKFIITNGGSIYKSGISDLTINPGKHLFIDLASTGNIGVGVSNPTSKLHVSGDIKGDFIRVSDAGVFLKTSTSDLALGFYNNFRIAPLNLNGRVVIGATTITSGTYNTNDVKLTVDGHAIFKKVIVTQNAWADFVFAKDYKLRPLAEVEQFINTNKHLPDVPSENEVLENGISLGDMDAILLQKIEELTLYLIQLEKQNQELSKEISKIKKNK
jgi:hypothetical protein